MKGPLVRGSPHFYAGIDDFGMILGPAPNIVFRLIFSSPSAILPDNDGLTLRRKALMPS
jgi:hypothetical protein